uniref:Uncharacterized protein n=1 Tax=Cacopsylla melanoneura TaxID=428564 RepID=A0A8D9ARY8_9HEMI
MKTYIASLTLLSTLGCISTEDRWVWGDSRSGKSFSGGRDFNDVTLRGEHSIAQPVVANYNRNRNNKYQNQQDEELIFNPNLDNQRYKGGSRGPQNRYEVEENLNSGLITIQPSRPLPNQGGGGVISLPPRPIPGPIPLPQNQRPGERFPPGPVLQGGLNPNSRPGSGQLVPAQSRPGGAIAGPPPSVGILTGPVPSWEKGPLNKNGDPTSFQNCKCAHSFNCKAPGIQFGKCDEGKQYCCFNDLNGPNKKEHGPSGPLRGPGGDNEGFGSEPLILTGPSSPGGHYGAKPAVPHRNGPNQGGFGGGPRDYDDFEPPSRYSQFERSRSAKQRN